MPKQPVTIWRASEEDLRDLVEIDAESFPLHPYGPVVMRQMLDISGGLFLVANQERTAGFVIGAIEADDPSTAWMLTLAVGKEFRRKGVGHALTQGLLDQLELRQIKRCRLTVEPENEAAISLYRGFGWQPMGSKEDYFDGQPRILLELELAEPQASSE